jgi:hypothetical protein
MMAVVGYVVRAAAPGEVRAETRDSELHLHATAGQQLCGPRRCGIDHTKNDCFMLLAWLGPHCRKPEARTPCQKQSHRVLQGRPKNFLAGASFVAAPAERQAACCAPATARFMQSIMQIQQTASTWSSLLTPSAPAVAQESPATGQTTFNGSTNKQGLLTAELILPEDFGSSDKDQNTLARVISDLAKAYGVPAESVSLVAVEGRIKVQVSISPIGSEGAADAAAKNDGQLVPTMGAPIPPPASAVPASPVKNVTRARLEEAFALIDKDSSGELSRAEVIKALRMHEEVRAVLGLGAVVRQEDGTRDAFEAIFQRIDTNADKKISLDEFCAALDPSAPRSTPSDNPLLMLTSTEETLRV